MITAKKYDEFLADFNLFLCEWFGHRDSAHLNTLNRWKTIDANELEFNLYIRLWEHSGDIGLPDNTVIVARATFRDEQRRNFENLLRFFKAYAPLYGFNHIAIELPPIDYDGDKTEYGFHSPEVLIADKWQCAAIESLKLPQVM